MRRFAVLLLAVVLLAGCGSLSRRNQSGGASFTEVDFGAYIVMLGSDVEQCPGATFADCRVRLYPAYMELHVNAPDGTAQWVPVVGMPLMAKPHP